MISKKFPPIFATLFFLLTPSILHSMESTLKLRSGKTIVRGKARRDELLDAAMDCNIKKLRKILPKCKPDDINHVHWGMYTPLSYILESSVPYNWSDSDQKWEMQKLQATKFLLQHGADPNNAGKETLGNALRAGFDFFKLILPQCSDETVNRADKYGTTFFHRALDCVSGYRTKDWYACFDLLMQRTCIKKIINKRAWRGETPLYKAVGISYRNWLTNTSDPEIRKQKTAVIETLLKHGANPNMNFSYDNLSPLSRACARDDVESVKLLLPYATHKGRNPGLEDAPLMKAAEGNNLEIAQLLLPYSFQRTIAAALRFATRENSRRDANNRYQKMIRFLKDNEDNPFQLHSTRIAEIEEVENYIEDEKNELGCWQEEAEKAQQEINEALATNNQEKQEQWEDELASWEDVIEEHEENIKRLENRWSYLDNPPEKIPALLDRYKLTSFEAVRNSGLWPYLQYHFSPEKRKYEQLGLTCVPRFDCPPRLEVYQGSRKFHHATMPRTFPKQVTKPKQQTSRQKRDREGPISSRTRSKTRKRKKQITR